MPHHLQPQIKDRLYALSPRAFEFFAGDLLTFLGLAAVTVTRYRGDGGIDASCELVSGGILRVPAGVQVKKLRQAVPRSLPWPEMDRIVGALANRYSCGIFMTTGGFTKTALQKAAQIPHVTTVDGDQMAALMVAKAVGLLDSGDSLDEHYFDQFEARAGLQSHLAARPQLRPAYRHQDRAQLGPAGPAAA